MPLISPPRSRVSVHRQGFPFSSASPRVVALSSKSVLRRLLIPLVFPGPYEAHFLAYRICPMAGHLRSHPVSPATAPCEIYVSLGLHFCRLGINKPNLDIRRLSEYFVYFFDRLEFNCKEPVGLHSSPMRTPIARPNCIQLRKSADFVGSLKVVQSVPNKPTHPPTFHSFVGVLTTVPPS